MQLKIKYLSEHLDLIPKIADWFYKEWRDLLPGYTLDDVIKRVAERVHQNKLPLALVAFDGKDLLGTVGLKKMEFLEKPLYSPWLAGLYVKKSRREAGIGSQLVEAVEKKAAELGFSKLYLHTPKSVEFYQKLGWSALERMDIHGSIVTIMSKDLFGQISGLGDLGNTSANNKESAAIGA